MNQRPAVILAALDDVHFVSAFRPVETTWSMFGLEHQVRTGLPIHTLRVTMTVGPDLRPRVLLSDERIVLRHAAVVVQAQRLAAERIESLRDLAARGVARGDVEFAVWTKTNTTARVKLCRGNVLDDHRRIDQAVRRFAIARYAHF